MLGARWRILDGGEVVRCGMQSLLGERACCFLWNVARQIDIERMSERAAFTPKSWRRSSCYVCFCAGDLDGWKERIC